jgi:predicted transcriptional regulator
MQTEVEADLLIIEKMLSQGEVTTHDIIMELNLGTADAVLRRMKKLVNDGKAIQVKAGKWRKT